MTVDAAAGRGVGCRQCGVPNRTEDRFCLSCGTALIPGPRPNPGVNPPMPPRWLDDEVVDSTTRYLCAAAHMDQAFARDAIGEYLIEPVRAVPPSPGIDAVAVLRDAVAARRRGKIRDGLLAALVVIALFTVTGLTIAWIVIGVVVAMAVPSGGAPHRVRAIVGGVVALFVLVLVVPLLSSGTLGLLFYGLRTSGATMLGALVLALLVFGVLTAEEMIVEQLTRDRFRRSTFRADATTTSGWERTVRMLGLAPFAGELGRVAAAAGRRENDGNAEVVVHRGWVPFVGSGRMVTDQTLSLPLKRAEEHIEPRSFTAAELNAAVHEAMRDLRRSASLSPGRRLARLEVHEQVFLPADQLTHASRTPLGEILTHPRRPPLDRIPIRRARALADAPVEAGRYYLCFRIEAWDRDLVTSCFLTTATDQRTLYLEWSNSVLLPLKARYRAIDRPADLAPGLRALLAALTLPATLPSRIANLVHYYRRIPHHHDEVVAERYGAGKSLRELAAAGESNNFFQEADAIRYVQLVEQALFRAVSQFLGDRGYSVTEVMDVARARIAGNITINGGTFTNSAVGIGHTEQGGGEPARHAAPQPPQPRRTR